MTYRAALALIAAAGAGAAGHAMVEPVAGGPAIVTGVANPARARQNWILKCQGCHRADASGSPRTTPAMAGIIGRFLATPEGRTYLVQVPGVATAALPDEELAELLNWTLLRFDAAQVPGDFTPYTASEVGGLRRTPLRTEAAQVRTRIIAALGGDRGTLLSTD